METRYFTPTELHAYIVDGELASDLRSGEVMGRCSIADLIELCEQQKKGGLRLSRSQLLERLAPFINDSVLLDVVSVAEVDSEVLSQSLLPEKYPTTLWDAAAKRNIPPLHSLRRISLKESNWDNWGGTTYSEMENYFDKEVNDDRHYP